MLQPSSFINKRDSIKYTSINIIPYSDSTQLFYTWQWRLSSKLKNMFIILFQRFIIHYTIIFSCFFTSSMSNSFPVLFDKVWMFWNQNILADPRGLPFHVIKLFSILINLNLNSWIGTETCHILDNINTHLSSHLTNVCFTYSTKNYLPN